MYEYLKRISYYGLNETEKKEMKSLQKELKKYKEMELVSKSNSDSGSEN